MHIVQGQGVARRWHGVARTRLHIVPPAVVSAGESHNFSLFAVVSGQSHGLHHRLGARHVKRHLVFARQSTQAFDVVQHTRVVAAQDGAQLMCQGSAFGHARFVKVVAEQVDTVGAHHVDELIAVHVAQGDALATLPKIAHVQVLGQQSTKLVGHTVLAGELHVRNHGFGGLGMRQGQRTASRQGVAQGLECRTTLLSNVAGCAIHRKPCILAVTVSGQPMGKALGHAQMPAQGRVLGKRQLQPLHHSLQQHGSGHQRCCRQHHRHTDFIRIHVITFRKPYLYDTQVKK